MEKKEKTFRRDGGAAGNRDSHRAAISSGSGGSGGIVTVGGGNVKAVPGTGAAAIGVGRVGSSEGTLTDKNGNDVSLVTITLMGVTEEHTAITAVADVGDYGLTDIYTLDTNKLYFYLPAEANPTAVTAGGEVYTGTLDENRTGTFTNVPETISVEVVWGTMNFTYSEGTWDTETHTYEGAGWMPTGSTETEYTDTNKITVTNNGTEAVAINLSFETAADLAQTTDLTGSFWNRNGAKTELAGSSLLLNPAGDDAANTGNAAEVWLRLNSSKPTDDINGTLGAVTVIINSVPEGAKES